MNIPSEAYNYLLGVASAGREYTHNEVFEKDTAKEGLVIGKGHDIVRDVQVLDPEGVPRLAGKAALRFIGLDQPDGSKHLFLRTRLDWTVGDPEADDATVVRSNFGPPNYTGKYMSWAKYIVDGKGAQRLNEQLRLRTTDEYRDSKSYHKAEWLPEYPASFLDTPELGVARAEGAYYRQAVQAAQSEHPALLGMLSTGYEGIVHPKELLDIANWVAQNLNK